MHWKCDALTDETGVIKTQYAYDPFGNVTISGEPSDNPFQLLEENDGTDIYSKEIVISALNRVTSLKTP